MFTKWTWVKPQIGQFGINTRCEYNIINNVALFKSYDTKVDYYIYIVTMFAHSPVAVVCASGSSDR